MSKILQKEPIRVSILGSTSHIAKNLILYFSHVKEYRLLLFARSIGKVRSFMKEIQLEHSQVEIYPYEEFLRSNSDVVINCIGVTHGSILNEQPNTVFEITEFYDNLSLQYLQEHPDCLYIHVSSGAVYGGSFAEAAGSLTKAEININRLENSDFYGISKLYLEAKHRSLRELNIVDLRVFNFFSRFIDITSRYLLCDIINSIRINQPLFTTDDDIIRDYIHPTDFINIVELCIRRKNLNAVYDVYSKQAISKADILEYYQKNYNLRLVVQPHSNISIAGYKKNYFTNNYAASDLGYIPECSSLDCIRDESRLLFQKLKNNEAKSNEAH